ncbi:hypothetical protein D8911_11665 [Levilactobacillus brevis]|nr:hypothetical protein D8911_11665 [Levilactobacillus brevis]
MTTFDYQKVLDKEVRRLSKLLESDPLNTVIIDSLIKLGHEAAEVDQLRFELEDYRRREHESREQRLDTRWRITGTVLAVVVSVVTTLLTIQLIK